MDADDQIEMRNYMQTVGTLKENELTVSGWAATVATMYDPALKDKSDKEIIALVPKIGKANVKVLLDAKKSQLKVEGQKMDRNLLRQMMGQAGFEYTKDTDIDVSDEDDLRTLQLINQIDHDIGVAATAAKGNISLDDQKAIAQKIIDDKVIVEGFFWDDSPIPRSMILPTEWEEESIIDG